jgi:hypothetical protein
MKYQWRLGRVVVTICAVFFSSGWFKAHLQAQDAAAIAHQFVGMWRLVSGTQRLADGTTRQHPEVWLTSFALLRIACATSRWIRIARGGNQKPRPRRKKRLPGLWALGRTAPSLRSMRRRDSLFITLKLPEFQMSLAGIASDGSHSKGRIG